MARNLGLPLGDIDASVSAAFGSATRPVDVGMAELEDETGNRSSQAFLVMAGIGLDAQMAQDTSALAKRHLAYVRPPGSPSARPLCRSAPALDAKTRRLEARITRETLGPTHRPVGPGRLDLSHTELGLN